MNIFKTSGQRSPNKLLKFLNETPGIVNPKVPEKASYLSMVLPFMQGTRPLRGIHFIAMGALKFFFD